MPVVGSRHMAASAEQQTFMMTSLTDCLRPKLCNVSEFRKLWTRSDRTVISTGFAVDSWAQQDGRVDRGEQTERGHPQLAGSDDALQV